MSVTPEISVLMPVYNAENYLASAISSVLDQTCTNFELILINDGSSDNSLSIIEQYQASDPRVVVISRENKGLIASLNEGIGQAKGEFVARMDADDLCYPDRFEIQLGYLKENPDCVAVGTRAMLMDQDDMDICPFLNVQTHEDIDALHMNVQGGAIVHPSAMIRLCALKQVGGYRPEFVHAEDIDLFLRLAEIGRLANISETLIRYRQHLKSIGYKHRRQQAVAATRAVTEACARRGVDCQISTSASEAEPTSIVDNYLKWAWWSLQGGNTDTARKYAKKAVLSAPFNFNAWKAFACSIRGY